MAVALNNDELKQLRRALKIGEYDGVDLMHAWLAIDELIELREWRDKISQSNQGIHVDTERG